jgi:hypothetical protein
LWVHSDEETELEVFGEPVGRKERVLEPGWHLVGAVNEQKLRGVDGVRAVYAFDEKDGQYSRERKSRNGKGFWVFVDKETVLPVN